MSMFRKRTAYRSLAIVCMLLGIAACGDVFTKESRVITKPAPPAEALLSAREYVKNLALAQLSASPQAEYLRVINAYSRQTLPNPASQDIVVLEYKNKPRKPLQKIAVPVLLDQKTADFPDLLAVARLLAENHVILQNLYVTTAKIVPDKKEIPPDLQYNAVSQALNVKTRQLIENTVSLSTPDHVRAQLQLLRFFITHRFRDAAYLAADNAKKMLASQPVEFNKREDIKQLLQQLEQLEKDMREVMPFGL